MNHTTPMESPITNEQLSDKQKQITAALQARVLFGINNNTPFRQDLEAIRFSVEITERFSYIRESEQYAYKASKY